MSINEQLELLMQGTEYGDLSLEHSMRSELRQLLLEDRPLKVYCGYDPTATDLHLGHTITIRKLRQFQDLGHEVTFLIGDYTALIGDPSDKNKTRPILAKEDVQRNAKTFAEQAFNILDSKKTVVRYNSEWLSELGFVKLIELAQQFTVQQFLARNNFALRIADREPIYLHETFYALMQGYDAVAMEADVQVGGTDQLFNIVVAGRKLQQSMGLQPQVGIVLGILPGTDGEQRMSKTMGNHIPINSSPEDMFGKIMSIPDHAMDAYWRLATRYSPDQIERYAALMESGKKHPKDAKMELASEITEIFWGAHQSEQAKLHFETVFQAGALPGYIDDYNVDRGSSLIDVLIDCEFSESRSAARRLIEQGAVKLNSVKILDINTKLDGYDNVILQVGKRRVINLVIGV
ncbi:MAG: tyrosine--tRNA ligase [Chloroflexi bacterium]|nr:tyrosine--tRNA ligase [Chloroflexota bacterium]HCU80912.1 tyrosine--tRNA ligase [Chloroflexota bacterium]